MFLIAIFKGDNGERSEIIIVVELVCVDDSIKDELICVIEVVVDETTVVELVSVEDSSWELV